MIIYVSYKDRRSYGFSQDVFGGNSLRVEVDDNFVGGNKYLRDDWTWAEDTPYEETIQDKLTRKENERQALIADAKSYIESKMWPSKLSLGRLSEDETSQFNLWLDYIDALEAFSINENEPIWPTAPDR